MEHNTIELLEELGVAKNLKEKSIPHHDVLLSFNGERVHIPFEELTGGRNITIYGQHFVVRDLIANLYDEEKREIFFEAETKEVEGIETENPIIYYF